MERLPNPQQVKEKVNAGYKCFDRYCAVFDYPDGSHGKGTPLYLFPNSFAHFSLQDIPHSSNEVKKHGDSKAI